MEENNLSTLGLTNYEKYRASIIRSTLKYRSNHRQEYNDYQRNRYNTNPEAREKKLILMRAYNSKRKQRDEPIEKTKDI